MDLCCRGENSQETWEAIPQDEDLLLFSEGLQCKAQVQDGIEVGKEVRKFCYHKATTNILFSEYPGKREENAKPLPLLRRLVS